MNNLRSTLGFAISCDILIIGVGIVVGAAAYHLFSAALAGSTSPPSIALLIARALYSGATGWNVVCSLWAFKLVSQLQERHSSSTTPS
jgi:glycine/D-amino acid oxidase-like deaminating enzyme